MIGLSRLYLEKQWCFAGAVVAAVVMLSPSACHGQSRIPMTATRAPSAIQKRQGTVAGYVFWDQSRVAFNPSVPCQGLQVELDVITGTGMQKLATSSHLQFTQSQRPGPGLGLCTYSFSQVPKGVALQVQVTVGSPFGSHVAAKGPLGAIGGLIKIPGGQCNNSSNGITLSSTYLESGWVGCGDNAYNVNFELVPANTMATLPQRSTMLIQQASGTNTPPRTMLLQPNGQPGGPAQSNGALVSAVRPVTSVPSAQPTASTTGGFTGGIRPSSTVQPNAPPLEATVSNPGGGSAGAPSALIGLLRKQGSLKVISGQRTHYTLSPSAMRIRQLHQPAGGQLPAGHTMSAPVGMASRLATAPAIARNLKIAYIPSDLLNQKENVWCEQQEAQGAAPAILRIDGKTAGMNYSPDPKTNPHTIVGCGFGNGGAVNLQFLQDEAVNNGWGSGNGYTTVTLYTAKFNVQSWTDHEIVASIDPNTAGVPDWFYFQLEVKARLSGYQICYYTCQFSATKKSIPLTSIPQKESSLYQSGSPYFLSPVSNYYGLDGSTVAVMRNGLTGPVAGQDQFTVPLAPGFAIDSTQTDLLVSDTNANVTNQPATVNGNTITVTYPVVSLKSGNSTIYYSIYGLKVWVTGPVGLNPIAQ